MALSLVVCTTTGAVVHSERTPIYSVGFLFYAAKDGALLLVVPGNPFTAPAARTHRELSDSVRVPKLGGPFFRLTAAPASRDLIRLVRILSSTDARVSAANACGELGRTVSQIHRRRRHSHSRCSVQRQKDDQLCGRHRAVRGKPE